MILLFGCDSRLYYCYWTRICISQFRVCAMPMKIIGFEVHRLQKLYYRKLLNLLWKTLCSLYHYINQYFIINIKVSVAIFRRCIQVIQRNMLHTRRFGDWKSNGLEGHSRQHNTCSLSSDVFRDVWLAMFGIFIQQKNQFVRFIVIHWRVERCRLWSAASL